MNQIFLTGSNGFVGSYLINYLRSDYEFYCYQKGERIVITQDIVIHLAGIAHDLKNISEPSDYYINNTEFTKKVFDEFLISNAKIFIFTSSVKAVADNYFGVLTEETICNPSTHYGKSKLLAEQYILSKEIPNNKFVIILRPTMIHGPGNKGNFNLLFQFVQKGIPWPLGSFHNKKSFCGIDNFCYIIKELVTNQNLISGIYNVSEDHSISTNEVVVLMSKSLNKKIYILKLPKALIHILIFFIKFINKDINLENLEKLISNFEVSNLKLKKLINKPLPTYTREGLSKTFNSFIAN